MLKESVHQLIRTGVRALQNPAKEWDSGVTWCMLCRRWCNYVILKVTRGWRCHVIIHKVWRQWDNNVICELWVVLTELYWTGEASSLDSLYSPYIYSCHFAEVICVWPTVSYDSAGYSPPAPQKNYSRRLLSIQQEHPSQEDRKLCHIS